MRKTIFVLILIFGIMGSLSVFAHEIKEAEGKATLGKLQSNELNCANLSESDFRAMGDYFMGQMAGDSHEAMDKMMKQMMGEAGEEEMHVVIGKRMSECDLSAQLPQNMMNMMMGGGMMNQMMNFGGWGLWYWFGWILSILFLIALALGLIALIKWLINK